MNPLAPYWTAIKWGSVVLLALSLVGLGLYWGHGWGQRAGTNERAALARKVELLTSSRDSWQRLAEDRTAAVQAQNAAAKQAIKAAELERVAAEAAEARANAAADRFLKAKAEVERMHAQESHGDCADWAKERVCGSPLR